ncbi:hypothetical protein AB0I27_16630 [Streptomyces sp. NPDC050597]
MTKRLTAVQAAEALLDATTLLPAKIASDPLVKARICDGEQISPD